MSDVCHALTDEETPEALLDCGTLFLEGTAVLMNKAIAARHFRRSADLGNALA
jgi:hypothetical protein